MCLNASLGCTWLPLILCPTSSLWSVFMDCSLHASKQWTPESQSFPHEKERSHPGRHSHNVINASLKSVSLPRNSCFYNKNAFFPLWQFNSLTLPSFCWASPYLSQSLEASQGDGDCTAAALWVLELYWPAFKSLTQVTLPINQPHCIK